MRTYSNNKQALLAEEYSAGSLTFPIYLSQSLQKFPNFTFYMCIVISSAHCNYLNNYISQKIRHCVVYLEGQFQTTLQAKPINFLIWKFRSIILIFLLFFAGVVKSSAFCTLLMLFPKGWIIWVTFLRQIAIQVFQLFGSTVCKKHWIWQLLQKIEGKWE